MNEKAIIAKSLKLETWLESTIGFERFNPGLERINNAIQLLNLYPKNSKIITVAGTNGKGTVSRSLHKSLCAKYRCAIWTSPHILSIGERCMVGDKSGNSSIEIDLLENLFIKNHTALKELNISLSFYEFLFIVFLDWIKDQQIDYITLEVGLGGRLDATNAIDCDIALVTSISRDHQEFLGESFSSILHEKLGVCGQKTSLVTALELSYLRQQSQIFAKKLGIPWQDVYVDKKNFWDTNSLLVQKALQLLGEEDLAVLKNPASHQFTFENDQYELYGSHNTDGVRKLVHFLINEQYNNQVSCNKLSGNYTFEYMIISFSQRKLSDIKTMLTQLSFLVQKNLVKKMMIVGFEHFKAMPSNELKAIAEDFGIKYQDDFKEVIKSIKTSSNNEQQRKVLCVGSNYFVGELLRHFHLQQSDS